jgi:hypothetical protein
MIELSETDRTMFRTAAGPSPLSVPAPSPEGTTLISEQQVLFGTAAAAALRPAKGSRWITAMKSVSDALGALLTRPPAQRYVARRFVYLETAAMGREMYRL